MAYTAILVLQDGTTFYGESIGVSGSRTGEVVFNTSICGYQEILTDPSYAKQIVTLTYPHIGNVGTNSEDEESRLAFCSGLVIKNLPKVSSNWRQEQSLSDYLQDNEIVAIANIDTRKLTRHIRIHGAQKACIMAGENLDVAEALSQAQGFEGLNGMDLAKEVTTDQAYQWSEGVWDLEQGYQSVDANKFKVVAMDFGVKRNILRILAEKGCAIDVVPATTTAEEILAYNPDGVFLSNGPGDPEPCEYAIKAIRTLLEKDIPIFGICLGHQLLSLASGAQTEKMKFGHHGANHPVQDMDTKKVYITSQNHGFTVQEQSLSDNIKITHKSLFDNTIQGIERVDKPAFSFQGHPEASPGPMDIEYLFDRFIDLMTQSKS